MAEWWAELVLFAQTWSILPMLPPTGLRDLNNYCGDTSQGRIVWTASQPWVRVLMIHGFMRNIDWLAHWRALIPGIGFLHLPSHGRGPDFAALSLESWIQGIGEFIARFPEPPLIIAESMGAVIAMTLPSKALIAVEPLLSTDKLWPLRRNFRDAEARGIEIDPAMRALFDQPFDWALNRISAPTLVLAGDEPLLPERETEFTPSVLTDDDFSVYASHPLVEAHRVRGGHDLLINEPGAVMQSARPFMIRHGYLPGGSYAPLATPHLT